MEIAELLELAPAEVQDTLSFYGIFKQDKPHGEVRAWVCRSISCALRGSEEVLDHMLDKSGIEPGETTPDGAFDARVCRVPRRLRIRSVHARQYDAAQGSDCRTSQSVFGGRQGAIGLIPIRRFFMPPFEPVLLANIDKPDSHTLRIRSERRLSGAAQSD